MVRLVAAILLLSAAPAYSAPHQGIVLGGGDEFALGHTVEGGVVGELWLGWMVRPDLAVSGWAAFHAFDTTDESRRQLGAAARWWPTPDLSHFYVEARMADDRHGAVSIHHGLSLGAALGYELFRRRRFALDLRAAVDLTTLDAYVDRNQATLGFAVTIYIATR